jgi:hypothetical protein
MKCTKKFNVILISSIILVVGMGILSGCSNNNPNNTKNNSVNSSNVNNSTNNTNNKTVTGKDTDGDGIPDPAEKLLGTNPYTADTDGDGVPDKLDKTPMFTSNLIKETSKIPLSVKIKDARVEDNVNASDHLEITLTNTSKTNFKDFDMYFTVTDTVTKAQEGYYVKLLGFTLEAGTTKILHFDNKNGDLSGIITPLSKEVLDKIKQDNKSGELHYNGNMNGIYGTSKNEVLFQGEIHANGYAPIDFTAKKSKGTAETAD